MSSSTGTRVYFVKIPDLGVECESYSLSECEMSLISDIEKIVGRNPINSDIAVRVMGDPFKLCFRRLHNGVNKALIFYERNRSDVSGSEYHCYYANCLYDAVTGENSHLKIEDWTLGVIEADYEDFCLRYDGILTPSKEGYLLQKQDTLEYLYFSLRTGMFYCLPISLF